MPSRRQTRDSSPHFGSNGLFNEAEWCALLADLSLSKRQAEILRLIFDGLCDKQIAQRLDISPPTVRTYVQRVYARLGVSDRAQLVIEVVHRSRSPKS